MPWPQTGATQYNAQFGLPDKVRAIKGLLVFNDCDLEPVDLLNGMLSTIPWNMNYISGKLCKVVKTLYKKRNGQEYYFSQKIQTI